MKYDFFNSHEFIDPCLCNAWVGTAVLGSAVIGAGATIFGANKAADAQVQAADKAIGLQRDQYNLTRTDLAPYRDTGVDAAGRLRSRLSELTTPISVNPDDFTHSDQYKFLENQGQRGVTNSAAARGLATSGAALKGAAAFETNLNKTQWQSNFDNQVTNQTNAYSRLKGLLDTGENAGAQTGALGEKAAYNSGVATVGAGNAVAAADNKTGSAISNLSNGVGGYAMYQGMYGSPGGGGFSPGTVNNGIAYGGPGGPTPFAT